MEEPVYLKDVDLTHVSVTVADDSILIFDIQASTSGSRDFAIFVTASSRLNLLSGVPLSALEMVSI